MSRAWPDLRLIYLRTVNARVVTTSWPLHRQPTINVYSAPFKLHANLTGTLPWQAIQFPEDANSVLVNPCGGQHCIEDVLDPSAVGSRSRKQQRLRDADRTSQVCEVTRAEAVAEGHPMRPRLNPNHLRFQ